MDYAHEKSDDNIFLVKKSKHNLIAGPRTRQKTKNGKDYYFLAE